MGREVRRVPPNWDHPSRKPECDPYRHGGFQPMHDEHIQDALSRWLAEFDRVRRGDLSDFEREYCSGDGGLAVWIQEFEQPPDPNYCRPWRDDEATWWQVWETVSEGTPVTPPFATQAELVDYLVEHGDFWQQKRWAEGDTFMQPGPPGYSRKAAEAFVMGSGWVPSMIVVRSGGDVTVKEGIDCSTAQTQDGE